MKGLTTQREELIKVIQEDPYNWPAREVLARVLYKLVRENVITEDESRLEKEKIFREYLLLDPEHQYCKQELASVLQVKVKKSSNLSLEERKSLFEELVTLSSLFRFKEELAKILFTMGKNDKEIMELTAEMIESVYRNSTEMIETFKEFMFTEFVRDFSKESLMELEAFLTMLTKLAPSQILYRKKLAQCIWLQINQKEAEVHSAYKKYRNLKNDYQRCIGLDEHNHLYKESWIELLYDAEDEFASLEENEQIQQQKIDLYFDFLDCEPGNHFIKTKIENLLFSLVDKIDEKECFDVLSEREVETQREWLHRCFLKLESDNLYYKRRHTEAKMKLGRNLKTGTLRHQREAFQLFKEVVHQDSNHFDAQLRIAILLLKGSQYKEAHPILVKLEEKFENVQDEAVKVHFCLAYAITHAYSNYLHEAKSWMRKGKRFDTHGRFGTELAMVNNEIDICSSLPFYSVSINGNYTGSYVSKEINKLIKGYERERFTAEQQKIIIDLRNSSHPVLIGPKNTLRHQAVQRLETLTTIIEHPETVQMDQLKQTIKNIRDDLAKIFCSNSIDDSELKVARNVVMDQVLIYKQKEYKWAFKGDVIVIREEI